MGLREVGHPLFISDTYDVLIFHIGLLKSVCRIVVVPKRELALGKKAYGRVEHVGVHLRKLYGCGGWGEPPGVWGV